MDKAEQVLEPVKLRSQVEELEQLTLAPGFWDSQTDAQQTMERIARCNEDLARLAHWRSMLDDTEAALELAQEEVRTCQKYCSM